MAHGLRLPPSDTSPFDARLFVTQWLRRWGYRPLIPAAALLTSELVTNAVIHVREPFQVQVANTGRGVRVSVSDSSTELPALLAPEAVQAHGRGMRIVDAVATRWGADRRSQGDGKEVWFELHLDDETGRLLGRTDR
jgi:anti-sigma regulatory factor (Ser/Thr protein kinase)